ncbi:TauD/TfdA family dioxygenase [Streptomyces griseoruber]|uniref:TauD/TfdA family dioxygenase n=1 Tax=Streptomyces griseoruber TaxID=1943 RepID=UPI00099F8690|nr:TauD/TfdA family dioxygenase [Streptomyces griseoruber]
MSTSSSATPTAGTDVPDRPTLAHVIEGDGSRASLEALTHAARATVLPRLYRHGAVLLRGFPVHDVEGLDALVRAVSGRPLPYSERSSPRTAIKGNVYTSTDYPPDQEIFLHNENSYQSSWPMVLFFHCLAEPDSLGATPLADTRDVLRRIDPAVQEEFARRGWSVVRNFHDRLGVSWREVFGTEDRSVVEDYCRENGLLPQWRGRNGLRTTAVRRAVHHHPVTGEATWFNHAAFFHVSTLPRQIRDGLEQLFAEEDLPSNTYYGDGGRIPDAVLDHLRSCYRQATTRFDWCRGDVLIVDNMAVAHGREPFTGPRRIAVAMAEPSADGQAGETLPPAAPGTAGRR